MKQGNFLSTASAYVGVNSDTIYAFSPRSEKGEEPFKTFLDDYKKAKPTIEVACVNILADTIVNSEVDRALRVATARHLLKARYPAHWDKEPATQLEISGPQGAPVQTESTVNDERFDYSKLTVEELRTLKAIRAKAKV